MRPIIGSGKSSADMSSICIGMISAWMCPKNASADFGAPASSRNDWSRPADTLAPRTATAGVFNSVDFDRLPPNTPVAALAYSGPRFGTPLINFVILLVSVRFGSCSGFGAVAGALRAAHVLAADAHDVAVHAEAAVGHHEDDRLGDVLRAAALLQRVQAAGHLAGGERDGRGHLGLDEARGDGVDVAAQAGHALGGGGDHADDAGLGGGVVGLAAVAGDAGGRGHGDD